MLFVDDVPVLLNKTGKCVVNCKGIVFLVVRFRWEVGIRPPLFVIDEKVCNLTTHKIGNLKPVKHFFIAEDDPDDQELFLEALKGIDERSVCVTAFDGQQLLDKLANSLIVPDIIFLDLNMPKMNGKECLKLIKENSLINHVPVIIYSTSDDKNEMTEALESGAAFFLQKPSSFEALCRALSQIIFHD